MAGKETTPRTVSLSPDPHYWMALGKFVERFAGAETSLFVYLHVFAGIHHQVARALLGGHVDQLNGWVRRLWRAKRPDPDSKEVVEVALDQLTLINKMRSYVVHYPSIFTSDRGRVTSNITRALLYDDDHVKEYRISPYILDDMSFDLDKIGHHFTYGMLLANNPGRDREELRASLPALGDAWRYIPPPDHGRQAGSSARRGRGRPTTRPIPPGSFPG